jgi:squalene-hopene/tetraprenyl-beta-curcumene cyclase
MQAFIDLHGGIEGVRTRYGHQSVAARVIVGTWSLADLIDWNRAASLPIETFDPSHNDTRTLTWQVDRADLAPLLALGVASYKLHRPFNPLAGWRRGRVLPGVVEYIQNAQEPAGSFAGSVAATSLVVMSLAGAGMTNSPVVRRGVEYLFETVGAEGNWPGKSARPASSPFVPVAEPVDHSATA